MLSLLLLLAVSVLLIAARGRFWLAPPAGRRVSLQKATLSKRRPSHKPFLPKPTEEEEERVGGPGGAASPRPAAQLRNVDVRFISLAGEGKNGRYILAKAQKAAMRERAADRRKARVLKSVAIAKADAAKRMVYGVVYAPGEVDADGDAMEAVEVEKAMHGFMQAGRVGNVDVNHSEETGPGYVAESWLVKGDESGATVDATFPDAPVGSWAVGIKVLDDDTWGSVEKGDITGLSLGGYGERVAVEAEGDDLAKAFVSRVKGLLGISVPDPADVAAPVEKAVPPPPPGYAEVGEGHIAAALADTNPLTKGFRETLLQAQLWNVTNALTDSIREVMSDDDVTDKLAAVKMVLAEFSDWLEGQVTEAVAKGSPRSAPLQGVADLSPSHAKGTTGEENAPWADAIADLQKSHAEEVAALRDQIEALGDTTAGRQSVLGEDQPIEKASASRGFTFVN